MSLMISSAFDPLPSLLPSKCQKEDKNVIYKINSRKKIVQKRVYMIRRDS
jgi:hypothetical protein